MRPKYELGEVVLLQSVNLPQYNGEHTVTSVVLDDDVGFCYELDFKHGLKEYTEHWEERALRKKHTPGEMTFDNLMASLSSPKLITHQPQ